MFYKHAAEALGNKQGDMADVLGSIFNLNNSLKVVLTVVMLTFFYTNVNTRVYLLTFNLLPLIPLTPCLKSISFCHHTEDLDSLRLD